MLRKYILPVLLVFGFLSCANNSENREFSHDESTQMHLAAPPADNSSGMTSNVTLKNENGNTQNNAPEKLPEPAPQKKLIKNGNMRIQVEDYAKTRPKISAIITKHKGYVGSENESTAGTLLQNQITIRVPFNEFDAMVAELEKEAKFVESKNFSVSDVTAQFVDLQARLKTRKEVELRYIDFLKKAKNIEETLKIEEQIRQLREEIESAEGQLKLLADQVQYSTLNLDVYQNLPYVVEPQPEMSFFSKFGKAIGEGWRGFLSFVIGFMYLWPMWIIIVIAIILSRKFLRKKPVIHKA